MNNNPNLQIILDLYQPIKASMIGNKETIIKLLSVYLTNSMADEISQKIIVKTKKTASVIEIFQTELQIKILSLNFENIPLSEPSANTWPIYSSFSETIIHSYTEKLYIILVKYSNLCIQALNIGIGQHFTDYFTFKAKLCNFFKNNNIALSKDEFDNYYKQFISKFYEAVYDTLSKTEVVKVYKEKLENCKKNYYLSNIIVDTFLSIVEYSNECKDSLSLFLEQYNIISAISETLIIKIENLKESTDSFLKELKDYNISVLKIEEDVLNEWFSIKELNSETIQIFFENIENNPIIKTKLTKDINKQTDILYKKDMEYKKNQLLFEISTFNELLNYSIARLKESTEIDILMYIQVVEEANSMINTILTKYNIRKIEPYPQTLFNGKEHEVIMTQYHEDFKKGEIIRVANHGYHQNGVVIVRANVIVAR